MESLRPDWVGMVNVKGPALYEEKEPTKYRQIRQYLLENDCTPQSKKSHDRKEGNEYGIRNYVLNAALMVEGVDDEGETVEGAVAATISHVSQRRHLRQALDEDEALSVSELMLASDVRQPTKLKGSLRLHARSKRTESLQA
ncbi:MAG: hypothetical protein M1827_001883 [Pycnora praestabilis]|nr:MAG: hypothetical protein M1827_001883 [Pycnora praestabilis]